MKSKKLSEKPWFNGAVIACIGVICYVLLSNIGTVLSSVSHFLGNFYSILLGAIFAYILNPLANFFDRIIPDPYNGMDTYEDAESRMQTEAVSLAMEKSGVSSKDSDYVFAGDLLNQCTGSAFGMRNFGIPYLGQYGACSTMGQGLLMAALFVECGAAERTVCATSSHFCSAERQYRFPLEYGSIRTPTAQWTVTGAGSCVVAKNGNGARIVRATAGKITDLGITDANNMGAAMAPAICIMEP